MAANLTSLNRWLPHYCSKQGFGFVDNWGSASLLKARSLHLQEQGLFLQCPLLLEQHLC